MTHPDWKTHLRESSWLPCDRTLPVRTLPVRIVSVWTLPVRIMPARTLSVWIVSVWTVSVWSLDPVCLDPACLDPVCVDLVRLDPVWLEGPDVLATLSCSSFCFSAAPNPPSDVLTMPGCATVHCITPWRHGFDGPTN